ncbi:MAG: CDP-alcohol phosphatidyltransferase family protein [Candidatus Thermoplasmatota archaeon]|nr:CDP-alcohol phosphatidyltransferase family protein [Candidatus Thermoplasmatota archaeon]
MNKFRDKADPVIEPLAEKMSAVDPNLVSWLALVSAFIAGLFLFLAAPPFYVLLGGVFILLNSLFDALDGKIAKLMDKTSKRGDFLDHSLDRYADIFILSGIILGSLCRTWIGVFAIIGVLMTSYMGTQADAVGVSRDYGGIAGRAERLVLLILVSFLYFFLVGTGWASYQLFRMEFNLFELLMIWFAVAGNLTAIFRGLKTWSDLGER